MEHAEAHELLSDLALEPRRLTRLEDDPSAVAAELRAHLAGCDDCAADVAAWRRAWTEVGGVAGTTGPLEDGGLRRLGAVGVGRPILPPPTLRDRVLAAVRAEAGVTSAPPPAGPVVGTRTRRLRAARPWLVTAAALAVALITATSAWIRTAELDELRLQTADLAGATATLDRILAAERFWTVTLKTADGNPGGTLAWSPQEVVVITSGLPAPGTGQAYRCWVERDGTRMPMGWMAFSRSTGFWAGALNQYAPSLRPGGRFGVSLVPATGTWTPVLVGEL